MEYTQFGPTEYYLDWSKVQVIKSKECTYTGALASDAKDP